VKSRQSFAELYAFEIDRAADAAVFRQIYLQLRSAILSGTLRPATKLPSTRELAAQLGVSRSAVVSAFEQLLAEGYAFGKCCHAILWLPDGWRRKGEIGSVHTR
jgi:GntR family transcriptional regulator / MocR family aminotransferase